MKKLAILFGLIFAFQFALFAQTVEDTDDVIFNAHLLETFDIEVTAGGTQEITFATPADYNLGVTQLTGGIVSGNSVVTVNATANWDITIEAPDFVPGGANPGTGTIPINNLGYWIESIGTYSFGDELTLPNGNDASLTSLAMSNAPVIVIGSGTGNTGGEAENTFRFNWEMGTMRNNPAGPMNATTMFSQLAGGQFSLGDFTTTAVLSLRKL